MNEAHPSDRQPHQYTLARKCASSPTLCTPLSLHKANKPPPSNVTSSTFTEKTRYAERFLPCTMLSESPGALATVPLSSCHSVICTINCVLFSFASRSRATMSSPAASGSQSTEAIPAVPERGVLPTDVDAATGAVLIQSEDLPDGTPTVRGPNFDHGVNYDDLFASLLTTGFQATNLALAIAEVRRMIQWRMSDEPLPDGETEAEQPVDRSKVKCTVFLAFTSNMMSSGVREVIRYLCQHRMVDVLITTCGGIEEDVMKVLHPHYMGSFHLDGRTLRRKGQNRIGNLLVPNKNYVAFESFLTPLLDDMCKRQVESAVIQSPSSFVREMGKAINHPESVYYWSATSHTHPLTTIF